METRWMYRCPTCGKTYPIEPGRYLCDECAKKQRPDEPLRGVLECAWEGEAPARGSVPLPVEDRFFPPIPVGQTPLWAPERLRSELGMPNLWLKDDTCNPSGSYKDRASWLVAAFARKFGIREIVLASTGNAASSMACVGAAADIKIRVYVPKSAPIAKRVQILQYGAELVEVDGTYDLAFDQSLAYSRATGMLSRNTAYNPLTIEGKKTASFEIARDLATAKKAAGADVRAMSAAPAYLAPDHVFVPTGDGVIIAGVIRGFEDLVKLGWIERMPTVWAAQAEGSCAIARALETGIFEPRPSSTIADSISVDIPRNGYFALDRLRRHSGRAVVVSDGEILAAQRRLSRSSGLFAEPSSACAFAGFLKVKEQLAPGTRVVVMLTGSGLKDIKSAAKAVGLTI
ncbi:putative threonine synthase [uncultured spirochete]|jgi:threonine synthase|uniref:Putative threonine synthase n=1 Tax=uncultured spirochete TaxID=156406 RepID=A0A3P3XSU2_9SPIR|nr:putative threonine synthase [uncultured spirochete]